MHEWSDMESVDFQVAAEYIFKNTYLYKTSTYM